MKNLVTILLLLFGLCVNASADIWKWVDAQGKTHFVDTNLPIYTWVDEYGKVYYSDTPEHESAVSVEFMWHSRGSLSHSGPNGSQADAISGIETDPNETVLEQLEREMAQTYYCKRAKELYDAYANAPRLYKTNTDGEREYLSAKEAAATIAETEASVAEWCI
jgi:hypothetical protein